MIGSKPQDPTDKIQFSATAHTDLSVHVGGKPAKLAVITEDGTVVASGAKVAKSAALTPPSALPSRKISAFIAA